MNKYKILIGIILLWMSSQVEAASPSEFSYTRPIETPITDEWHLIELPPAFFGKVNQIQSDFRILGVKGNDTIEVPYVLRKLGEEKEVVKVKHEVINQVYNKRGAFFTFELPRSPKVNDLYFEFKNENFDWRVNLEGSNDQKEWFTIVENQRFIKERAIHFEHSKLKFPTVNYRYLRLHVKGAKEQPILLNASIKEKQIKKGKWHEFTVTDIKRKELKSSTRTNLYFSVPAPMLVSEFELAIEHPQDYHRVIEAAFTQDGWLRKEKDTIYMDIILNYVSSVYPANILPDNKETLAKDFRISIINYDNEPLEKVPSIKVRSIGRELLVRFPKNKENYKYALYYGQLEDARDMKAPKYDIRYFKAQVPDEVGYLQLKEEVYIAPDKVELEPAPLITNSWWLWLLMGVIILVLGGFTLMMVKNV